MKIFGFFMAVLLMAIALPVKAEDGGELFKAQKCVKCHSIDSQGIEAVADKEPEKVHDLSNAGATAGTAEEIKAYMLREAERNGKKHKSKFKGTEEELQALIAWLLTLKT